MSTLGDVQYIGGVSWYMWGSNLLKSFQFLLKTPMYWTSPNVLNIPRCTRDIPQCTHGIPPMYWTPPDVLMVSPYMYHDIPPMYWTSPDVLMISPRCTWYPCDVLNTPRCKARDLEISVDINFFREIFTFRENTSKTNFAKFLKVFIKSRNLNISRK